MSRMTYTELINIMKENVSRGILLGGMGCVECYIPKRNVNDFKVLLEDILPVNVELRVESLSQHNISMKKGLFEKGIVNVQEKDSFFEVVDKYKMHRG